MRVRYPVEYRVTTMLRLSPSCNARTAYAPVLHQYGTCCGHGAALHCSLDRPVQADAPQRTATQALGPSVGAPAHPRSRSRLSAAGGLARAQDVHCSLSGTSRRRRCLWSTPTRSRGGSACRSRQSQSRRGRSQAIALSAGHSLQPPSACLHCGPRAGPLHMVTRNPCNVSQQRWRLRAASLGRPPTVGRSALDATGHNRVFALVTPRRAGCHRPSGRAGLSIRPSRHHGDARRLPTLAACSHSQLSKDTWERINQPLARELRAGMPSWQVPPVFQRRSVARLRTHAHRVAGAARHSIVERTTTRMGHRESVLPPRPSYAAGLCRVAESLRERGHLREALPRRPGGFSTPACFRPPRRRVVHSRRQWVCRASFHVWRERYEVPPVTRSGGMPVLDAAHHAKPTKDVEHGGGTHMPNQQKGVPLYVLCAVPCRAATCRAVQSLAFHVPTDGLDRSQRSRTGKW